MVAWKCLGEGLQELAASPLSIQQAPDFTGKEAESLATWRMDAVFPGGCRIVFPGADLVNYLVVTGPFTGDAHIGYLPGSHPSRQ